MGEMDYGIDPAMINRVAKEIAEVVAMGVEVGIVIGGGNVHGETMADILCEQSIL